MSEITKTALVRLLVDAARGHKQRFAGLPRITVFDDPPRRSKVGGRKRAHLAVRVRPAKREDPAQLVLL